MKFISKLNKFYRSAYTMGHFPSLTQVWFTKKKIFAYYGFLGDNNFGDELVFESAKNIFAPNIIIPVRKFMPISIAIFCRLFKAKFSGVIVGGGTLIGPIYPPRFFFTLLDLKKPVYVHGTGVHKDIVRTREWKGILSGHVYGGVRGGLSKENLQPVFPAVKIAGDAAFVYYDKANWDRGSNGDKSILVNMGTHLNFEGQNSSRTELKKFIKSLINSGYTVKFLPFHVIDRQLGTELRLEFPEIILLEQPVDITSAVNIFQDCSFAIGERLHFTVMAILAKTPFISLNYRKKHEDLLQSIELSHAGLQPGNFSFATLDNFFNTRSTFNWGSTESIIAGFKEFQISEALNFSEKN